MTYVISYVLSGKSQLFICFFSVNASPHAQVEDAIPGGLYLSRAGGWHLPNRLLRLFCWFTKGLNHLLNRFALPFWQVLNRSSRGWLLRCACTSNKAKDQPELIGQRNPSNDLFPKRESARMVRIGQGAKPALRCCLVSFLSEAWVYSR